MMRHSFFFLLFALFALMRQGQAQSRFSHPAEKKWTVGMQAFGYRGWSFSDRPYRWLTGIQVKRHLPGYSVRISGEYFFDPALYEYGFLDKTHTIVIQPGLEFGYNLANEFRTYLCYNLHFSRQRGGYIPFDDFPGANIEYYKTKIHQIGGNMLLGVEMCFAQKFALTYEIGIRNYYEHNRTIAYISGRPSSVYSYTYQDFIPTFVPVSAISVLYHFD